MCRGGELFDRIAECGKLDEETARRYLIQMAQAIGHCHKLHVYHRDLKPENILLDDNDEVKIADFGLAAMVQKVREDASFLRHTKCGSLMYAAPEVLVSDASRGYDAAMADIWSLGISARRPRPRSFPPATSPHATPAPTRTSSCERRQLARRGIYPTFASLPPPSHSPLLVPPTHPHPPPPPLPSHPLPTPPSVLYSMLSGALPFQAAHASRCPRYAMVQQRGVRVLCEANGFSVSATDLLVGMIEPDPNRRLTASGVLASRWVQPALPTDSPFIGDNGSLQKWSACLGDSHQPGSTIASRIASLDPAPSLAVSETASREEASLAVSDASIATDSSLNGTAHLAQGKRKLSEGLEGRSAQRPRPADRTGEGAGAGVQANAPSSRPPPMPHHLGGNDLAEDVPPGVNGMLVRSLGWVQLPYEKEQMMGEVASALDLLGVRYEVVKGELSHVVYVGGELDSEDEETAARRNATAAAALLPSSDGSSSIDGSAAAAAAAATDAGSLQRVSSGSGMEPSSPRYPAGQLCVRLRVVQDSATVGSELHIDRQAGDVLQFHSFYRDVRNQLAGANGWVNVHGRYEHNVYDDFKG